WRSWWTGWRRSPGPARRAPSSRRFSAPSRPSGRPGRATEPRVPPEPVEGPVVPECPPRDLGLCVCTFRRPELLGLVLRDVRAQTIQPRLLIVVDGDPASGEVERILMGVPFGQDSVVLYVPSNHANLAYQRYLGWKAAAAGHVPTLVYLDD